MTAETKIDLRWSVLWGVVIALSPLSGAARVARGETTVEEVMRVAPLIDA